MSRTVTLETGRRYYAGVDLPFFIPQSVVTAGAEDIGFRNIVWSDRDSTPPAEPRSDPLYSDSWDRWATGIYQGPTSNIVLDHAPAWIVAGPSIAVEPISLPTGRQPLNQAIDIARRALETQDQARIHATAAVLRQGGYPSLADVLDGYSKTLPSSSSPIPIQHRAPKSTIARPSVLSDMWFLASVGVASAAMAYIIVTIAINRKQLKQLKHVR